jgi:hypothetical protein
MGVKDKSSRAAIDGWLAGAIQKIASARVEVSRTSEIDDKDRKSLEAMLEFALSNVRHIQIKANISCKPVEEVK